MMMRKVGKRKRGVIRGAVLALCAAAYLCGAAYAQCLPDDNAYVYFHPAFANKSWTQTAYDSILIMPFDSLCSLAPASFDICGDPQDATGALISQDGKLYLVTSSYVCEGGCTPCILQYNDPVAVSLPGITLAQRSPLYLVKKQSVWGRDSIKALVATSLNQVLGLTISTAGASVVKRDTLKMTALTNGQAVVRIQGEYDPQSGRDTAVWVLGARGLARRFPLPESGLSGAEAKRDVGTDTVYCVGNGYAGTSSGTIYKSNDGGAFSLDSKPCSDAVMYINTKGAVGKNGAFLEFNAGTWLYSKKGTSDYVFGNFTSRWDGEGVELVDASWTKTAVTYHNFPSRISSTSPFNYAQNMTYTYGNYSGMNVTVTLQDPDNSFSDWTCMLKRRSDGVLDLKNDGKYTIQTIQGNSLCAKDTVRLASGIISFDLQSTSFTVSAHCMIGKYIPLCQSTNWKDYNFVNTKPWSIGDTIEIRTTTNFLKIIDSQVTSVPVSQRFLSAGGVAVSHRFINGSLVFAVTQGTAQKLKSILLYNLKGQQIASMKVDKSAILSVPGAGACGMVYVKFVFSDGSIACRPIVLVR
jgi:hypothetical protein